MEESKQRPKVGVGVMVFKNGKVLLQKRKGSHGEGEYACPGGHVEHLESFEETARREVREECGIEIKNITFQGLVNFTDYAPKHYVHVGLQAEWASGEPQVLEPHKADSVDWYSLDEIPEPLFEPIRLAFKGLREGRSYFDAQDK